MDGLLQDQQHITPHKPPYKALQRAPTILHYIIITDTKGLSVIRLDGIYFWPKIKKQFRNKMNPRELEHTRLEDDDRGSSVGIRWADRVS